MEFTLEYAADLVRSLALNNPEGALDLYTHFEQYFHLTEMDDLDGGHRAPIFWNMCCLRVIPQA